MYDSIATGIQGSIAPNPPSDIITTLGTQSVIPPADTGKEDRTVASASSNTPPIPSTQPEVVMTEEQERVDVLFAISQLSH